MATKNIVGHLVYLITGDSKEMDTSLKKSQDAMGRFTKFVKSALGIGGAVLSVRALIGVGKDLVATYAVQEKAEASLAAAIRATGGDVNELMLQYKDFASGIQEVTTIGDEQVLSLLQQAQSFGIARDKMQEATRGAIGLSKAFGIDMNTALRGIALAYEGNYAQLSRYIPALRKASKEAERQAILQKAMADGFEIAKAEADTATGAMIQLQNVMGDLKEEGGRAIAEFMKPAVRLLTEIVREAANAAAEMNRLRELTATSQERELTTVEQLEMINLRIANAEKEREAAASSMGIAIEKRDSKEIESLKQQQRALTEAMRWEAQAQAYRQKGEKEAAANAEAESKRQKELAKWIKEINDEYAKTPEGQRDILQAQIAKWEYELARAKEYKPQIQAILDMLYKQRDANNDIADDWKKRVDAITAETEAAMEAYQLRIDAERAYQEEVDRIRKEEKDKKKEEDEKKKEDEKKLDQALLDSVVSVWGDIDSVISAAANRELEIMRRQHDQELEDLQRQHDLELESFQGTEEEKAALSKQFREEEQNLADEYRQEEARAEYEAALNSWKLQLIGALAALARSILEAARNIWPIPALPMMALAGTMGGIQIAAINAAKPVPAYSEGVDMIVPPGYPNDSFLFRAESGEHLQVTPPGKENQTQIHVTVQLGSKVLYDDITRALDNGQIMVNLRSIKR